MSPPSDPCPSRAIVARSYGPPETLVVEPHSAPPPGPDDVTVRTRYAGVSFVDALVAAGRHQHRPALPFVPGSEFSGTVLAVGTNVGGISPGDAVCGGAMGGMFAQTLTLPAARVQRIPPAASMREAAVLRASYLTAWYALVTCGGVAAGDTVLVLGAAGAVGIAAIELARHLGATVIGSASSAAKRTLALAHGAHHAVDATAADWRDLIRAIAGPRGVDIVVDPVGGDGTERAFRTLSYRGRHLMIGFADGIPRLPANLPLIKGASLVGVLASYFAERHPEEERRARAAIMELFARGIVRPPVGEVFAFEDYAAALQAASGGTAIGRVLLDMA